MARNPNDYGAGVNGVRNGIRNGQNGGLKRVTSSLQLSGGEGYSCSTTKTYDDTFIIKQKVNNQDGFTTLISAGKNPSQASVHNAKALLVKNEGNIAAEILFSFYDWKDSSNVDAINSVNVGGGGATTLRTVTTILPAGDFFYFSSGRFVSYASSDGSPFESAGKAPVGVIAIEPKDINSGNEFRVIKDINSGTYADGDNITTDEALDATETGVDVTDADWWKIGDLFMVEDEVMRVVSKSSNTLTVERGVMGSTAATHTTEQSTFYFFGNEHLRYDVGKCQSDKAGRFKQSGAYFGYARTDNKICDGIVPGSVAIGPFYTEGGFLKWGLSGITPSTETGLAKSTAYSFTLVVDEFNAGGIDSTTTEAEISFTTDGSDTTFAGGGNSVLPKIQQAIDALYYVDTSGLFEKSVTISLEGGDVVVRSHSNHSGTIVGISSTTTATTPFDVGRFPSLSSTVPQLQGNPQGGGAADTIVYGPASSLAEETIEDRVTSKESINPKAFIFDDGAGNLLYRGNVVGSINYERGHCEWAIKELPNAEFKIYGYSHSAHSGGVSYVLNGNNHLESINARSLNPIANADVMLVIYG